MSNRAEVIPKAAELLVQKIADSRGFPSFTDILDVLQKVYDAGAQSTTDLDAARWRIFEAEFREREAKFDHYVALYPRMTAAYTPGDESLVVKHAACWRFDVEWTETSGNANTIPKFIDHLRVTRKAVASLTKTADGEKQS